MDSSPWNTKIGPAPVYDALSYHYVTAFEGTFGSDPTQYTIPVYEINSTTPLHTVYVSGYFSRVVDDARIDNAKSASIAIPLPAAATASYGSDGQITMWNRNTGEEWGLSGAIRNADGTWSAKSGYHYNTNWDGVPPVGNARFASRGAGLPFLAGLVRPCEIARGRIDHALAFAYDEPTEVFVYPATKSDGSSLGPPDLPEGARLQLDPNLTDKQITAWGCTGTCLTIAHAMQAYGMIIVDKSSRPKIFVEYEGTAHWNGMIKASTISKIPYSAFKVLQLTPP